MTAKTVTAKDVLNQIKDQSLPVLRACHDGILVNALLKTLEKCSEKEQEKAVMMIDLELKGRDLDAELKALEAYLEDGLASNELEQKEAFISLARVLAEAVRVELEVKALTQ